MSDSKLVEQQEVSSTELAVADDNILGLSDDIYKGLEGLEGVIVGDIGLKVSRVPIEKYKASSSKIDRIAFITKKVIAVKIHYVDGVGSFLCMGSGRKCCELSNLPKVRYLYPIVVYQTDHEGKLTGAKLELKMLSADEDLNKSIQTINIATKPMGGIDHIDLLVTCMDDKFQKITLNQSGPASWRKSKNAVSWVAEHWAADAQFAYMAVGRRFDDEAALLAAFGLDSGGSASNQAQQTFDISNTDLGAFFNSGE